MEQKTKTFDEWALVELMGHQRIAGKVTEAEIGGSKFVRVDVPAYQDAQPITKFLGPASIYAITPVSEETARLMATQIDSAPVNVWSARQLLEDSAAKDAQRKALSQSAGSAQDEDELSF